MQLYHVLTLDPMSFSFNSISILIFLTVHIISCIFAYGKMRQMWWSIDILQPPSSSCVIYFNYLPLSTETLWSNFLSFSCVDLGQLMVSYLHDLNSQFDVPLLIHLGSLGQFYKLWNVVPALLVLLLKCLFDLPEKKGYFQHICSTSPHCQPCDGRTYGLPGTNRRI